MNPGTLIALELPSAKSALAWLGLAIGLALVATQLIRLLLSLWTARYLLNQRAVFFELLPPAANDKVPIATQQLFTVLHGLGPRRTWLTRLIKPPAVVSLEVISTRAEGIRYIVRVSENESALLYQAIVTYLPEVRVRKVDDALLRHLNLSRTKVTGFKQTAHFAYPLKSYDALNLHDPIAYLTGSMTKLGDDDLMVFQLVISPTKVRQVGNLSKKILSNEDVLTELGPNHSARFWALMRAINTLLLGLTETIGSAYHGGSKVGHLSQEKYAYHRHQAMMKIKPARTISFFEQQVVESVNEKLGQSLFRADVRALVFASDKKGAGQKMKGVEAALASLSVPGYQSLKPHRYRPTFMKRHDLFVFTKRLPSLFIKPSTLLSVPEVANLYHFPNAKTNKTENIIKSLSRTLPAPVSLKNRVLPDIVLGMNYYHGEATPIGMTAEERERHVYVIGGTGNGKTTMLLFGIVQDIRSGKGVAVIDPHGDLAETVLKHIPEHRVDDVIFFNPDDLDHPIGLNLLEMTEGLEGAELLREKDLITESVVSVFRKIFSEDDSGGHRIEYILRNATQTALTIEGATLFTIFKLLTDASYRKSIANSLENPDLRNFWKNELGRAGDFQRIKMSSGITSKIGRFLFSASARRVLEQPKSTINFDDVLSSGKILICNFSKGRLGEDTSTLFGTTTLAKLQTASLRRARQAQPNRNPFYLYVDEFQNFATASFVQMLSEARKYKLLLTMAEQSTSQQEDQRMVDIILANVGTVVCFRSGSPRDEQLVLPLFSPYLEAGEIASLPTYNFYARLSAIDASEPLSGKTLLLEDKGSTEIAQKVVAASRSNYASTPLVTKWQVAPKSPEPKPVNVSNDKASTDNLDVLNQKDLYDENRFYGKFLEDLAQARQEVIIESPFMTGKRVAEFVTIFSKLARNDVSIRIYTRNPKHHSGNLRAEARSAMKQLKNTGVDVTLCDDLRHRKISIIDGQVLWEGSLNILSQSNSREIMRRTESQALCQQMLELLD